MRARPETTNPLFGFKTGDSALPGPVLALLLAAMLLSGAVAAGGSGIASAATAAPVPKPPMVLPDTAGVSSAKDAAGAKSCSDCDSWVVAGRPGDRTDRIARRFNARRVAPGLSVFSVVRDQATAFAEALRQAGRLAWAEPDRPVEPAAYPSSQYEGSQDWLGRIVDPVETTPPKAPADSPLIGLIEPGVDGRHPDLANSGLVDARSTGHPKVDSHGTTIAAIIGAPGGADTGIRGVWPGARIQHFSSNNPNSAHGGATCSTAATAIVAAVRAGASVLNLSYTLGEGDCYVHYLATQMAVSRNVLPVAAAGNFGNLGNPVQWPAASPHVLSVGALGPKPAEGESPAIASFSNYNEFVDLVAPGENVFAPALMRASDLEGQDPEPLCAPADSTDTTGLRYCWAKSSGTSFAAPQVAAAAAWLRQARPGLSALQVSRVLTNSARDLGEPGRDPVFGHGRLDINAALTASVPVADRFEPNDDIPLLKGVVRDGFRYLRAAPYFWKPRGSRVARTTGTLSRAKDPADVYRVRLPARTRVLIATAQLAGDVRLTVLRPKARSLKPKDLRGNVIVRSDKVAGKTEGVMVANRLRRARNVWVAITPSPRVKDNSATYRLTIKRRR